MATAQPVDEEEENDQYVAQLREVFDSCDTTGKGQLGRRDLKDLCSKLQLDEQSDALVERLLGRDQRLKNHGPSGKDLSGDAVGDGNLGSGRGGATVGFIEFKEAFVDVLSTVDVDSATEITENIGSGQHDGFGAEFWKEGAHTGETAPILRDEATPLDFPSELSDTEMSYAPSPLHTPKNVGGAWPYGTRHMTTPTGVSGFMGTLPETNPAGVEEAELPGSSRSIAQVYEADGELNRSLDVAEDVSMISQTSPMSREEQLRAIWTELGVGQNGFLTPSELQDVCEYINTDRMDENELANLFERLDLDQDGLVSFQEFLFGLFDVGGADGEGTLRATPNSRPLSDPKRPHSARRSNSAPLDFSAADRNTQTPSIISALSGYGFFSYLVKDHRSTGSSTEIIEQSGSGGYANVADIIELWSSFGLSTNDSRRVLESLEMDSSPAARVNLRELSAALEHEMLAQSDNAVALAGAWSCRQELRHTHGALENACARADKLRANAETVSVRLTELTREMEERQKNSDAVSAASMEQLERKHKEAMKNLKSRGAKEQERLEEDGRKVIESLKEEIRRLKAEEVSLRMRLSESESEQIELKQHLSEITGKYSTLEKEYERQRKEMASVSELHSKIAEMESDRDSLKDDQQRFAMEKVNQYKVEVSELRDHNDELTHELESVRQDLAAARRQDGDGRKKMRRRGSYLSDYTKRQRPQSGDTGSSEDNTEETSRGKSSENKLAIALAEVSKGHEEAVSNLTADHERQRSKWRAEKEEAERRERENGEQAVNKLIHNHEQLVKEAAIRHKEEMIDREHGHNREKIEWERKAELAQRQTDRVETEWKRKHDSLETQLRLKSAQEQTTLTDKLHQTHRAQMRELREDLTRQQEREVNILREQLTREKVIVGRDFQNRIEEFEGTFSRGLDGLKGKMKEDFLALLGEETAAGVERERQLLTEGQEEERARLYETVQMERDELGEQYREQVYDLEEQFEDEKEFHAEEIRSEMEEEFVRQIGVIKEAFDEERDEYEGRITALERALGDRSQSADKDTNRLSADINREKEDKMRMEGDNERLRRERDELSVTNKRLHNELETERLEKKRLLQEKLAAAERKDEARDSNQESEEMTRKNVEMETRLREAEERVTQAETTLELSQFEHQRELIEARVAGTRGHDLSETNNLLSKVKNELERERLRNHSLQSALDTNQTESGKLISDTRNGSHKDLLRANAERSELQRKLTLTQSTLSEVTEKLKVTLQRGTKSDYLLKDLYVENARLMQALCVTEQRQKRAEKTTYKKEATVEALQEALRTIAPMVAKV